MEDLKSLIDFFTGVTALYQRLGPGDVYMISLKHGREAVEVSIGIAGYHI